MYILKKSFFLDDAKGVGGRQSGDEHIQEAFVVVWGEAGGSGRTGDHEVVMRGQSGRNKNSTSAPRPDFHQRQ